MPWLPTITPLRLALVAGTTALILAMITKSASPAEIPSDMGTGHFQEVDCWIDLEAEGPSRCGRLTVPERWADPGGAPLTLPVIQLLPRNPDPHLAPVIFLAGGPGNSVFEGGRHDIAEWRYTADSLFPGRSLVLFEQRGVGLAQPAFDCFEDDDPLVLWPLSNDPDTFEDPKARIEAAYAACRDRLQEIGHDLAAFNSREIAADVEALRVALGLEPVVLFGISYGTRLALTVMRHYPHSVQAAILDSVIPPQTPLSGNDGEAFGAVLDRLFAACRAHLPCDDAYPDLERRFYGLLERLEAAPSVIEVQNLKDPAPLYLRVDHFTLLEILRRELYHTSKFSFLPKLIDGMTRGQDWRLRPHAEASINDSFPRGYSVGMTYSVACRDSQAVTPESRREDSKAKPVLSAFAGWNHLHFICDLWPSEPPDISVGTPVTSAIPTLLLAGALDASTPVEWAEAAAETLSNGELFVFPANAHVQLADACARSVLRAFLAEPQNRPDPACLDDLKQPAFLALKPRH